MDNVHDPAKVRETLGDIPAVPMKHVRKKKRPKEVAVVVEENCTGCETCCLFCPVGCIEHVPKDKYGDTIIPPVQVRFDECIGCQICARVCAKLAWDAIAMRPTEDVEEERGVTIHHG